MVQAFDMIARSMANQRGSAPSTQLQNASEYLAQHAQSGSGQIYAQGLAQAAQQFQGQEAVTPDNAMLLIQSLLGGGQQPFASGWGSAGFLVGRSAICSAEPGGDPLGTLLGQQQTGSSGGGLSDGIDMGDLVNAGMAFMNAKQQGQDNIQAALAALMSAGPMAQKPHRQQSGQLVANALLQAIAGMSQRR